MSWIIEIKLSKPKVKGEFIREHCSDDTYNNFFGKTKIKQDMAASFETCKPETGRKSHFIAAKNTFSNSVPILMEV